MMMSDRTGYKQTEHSGRTIEAWTQDKHVICTIYLLSKRTPIFSLNDDDGSPLRGVGHAIEAAKSLIDTVDKYGWGNERTGLLPQEG